MSESQPTLSVIIPTYNEARTIRQVIRRVTEAEPPNKELLIVDDGSTDGTREVLQEIQSEGLGSPLTNLRIFFQEKNQGKGAAIRRAIPEARGRVTIIQDADLETNPKEYPILIEPILQDIADVVYGSRFHTGRRRVVQYWHYLGNKTLTIISNLFTNIHLTDMETCYKTFKTEILQSLPLRCNRFDFEPEVTALIAKRRLRIYEVPISYEGRSYAEGKKIGFRDALQAVFVIIRCSLFDRS